MDYGDSACTSDSVQWQSSQTACAALNSLLSEVAFKAQPELFQSEASTSSARSTKRTPRSLSSSLTLNSTSSSVSSFATTPGSSRSTSYNTTPLSASSSSGWETSSNEHRGRSSRLPPSESVEPPPVRDPDEFLNMLKGISERIDGNIRNDTNSRDIRKRRPPSKRIAASPDTGAKRVKCGAPSAPGAAVKKKARDLGALSCTSTNIPNSPNPTVGVSQSHSVQLDDLGFGMDVDPPTSSSEIMPPPPIPSSKTRTSSSSPRLTPYQNGFDSPPAKVSTPILESPHPRPQSKPIIQAKDSTPANPNSATPRIPKLHPLLDPERKQRRLKLERTISASMGLFSSESPSTSKPPSTAVVSPVPARQLQEARPRTDHQVPNALPLSQGYNTSNASRPPTLGMRRTHTFPQNSPKPSSNSKGGLPTKQKPFKPPLLPSSQLPSTPSSNSSRGDFASSGQVSLNASSPTCTSSSSSRPGDEDIDALPLSSDADISFGDAVSFDVDMDMLEEAMRKYD